MASYFRGEIAKEVIEEIINNRNYRITKEGVRSDIYDFGTWFTKRSGYCSGPIWKLYRRAFLWGWIRQSSTNSPGIVSRWKKEYFGGK